MIHRKSYRALLKGGQVACSCGWKGPIVSDPAEIADIGHYFADHLAEQMISAETTMLSGGPEQTVGLGQRPRARKQGEKP